MPSSDSVLTEQFLYDHLASQVFACADNGGGDRVGIEVEFFPLLRSRLGTPGAQPGREGDGSFIGLYPWLLALAERHGWRRESAPGSPDLAFLLPGGGRVTLEPGGQVEYSSPPFGLAEQALEDVEGVERLLCREGESVGLIFLPEGFNRHLGGAVPALLVEKPRYLAMDRHFERIGPFGRQMMRRTCATQINLDFGSADVAPLRWRLANLIAPALNALFANSPHTLDGIPYRSYRYEIWRRADPCRAGRTVGTWDDDPVASYLHFALDASVMLIAAAGGRCVSPARPLSFRNWMRGEGADEHRFPTPEDWQLHLTTLFPHVRPRGFLEIRSVDGLSAGARRAAVVLAGSLLYNERLRDAALALCAENRVSWGSEVRKEDGVARADDWRERFALGRALLAMAVEETGNAVLRNYFNDFTARAKTPADSETEYEDVV